MMDDKAFNIRTSVATLSFCESFLWKWMNICVIIQKRPIHGIVLHWLCFWKWPIWTKSWKSIQGYKYHRICDLPLILNDDGSTILLINIFNKLASFAIIIYPSNDNAVLPLFTSFEVPSSSHLLSGPNCDPHLYQSCDPSFDPSYCFHLISTWSVYQL